MANLFDRVFKRRKITSNPIMQLDMRAIQQLLNGQGITTNQEARDRDYVEKGYQLSPIVYSCVSLVMTKAGQIPWNIYKKTDNSEMESELAEVPLLQDLLDNPNALMTWSHFIKELIMFYMLQGDMYIWAPQPEGETINVGKPIRLYPLPSQHVQIHADQIMGVKGYSLDYYAGGTNIEMLPENVLHLKNPNPEYDEDASFLYGQSPLRALRRSLDTNNFAIDTGVSYLRNQGPKGILSNKPNEHANFSKDNADAFKEEFKKRHQGTQRAGDILVTPNEFNYVEVGSTASDIALLEQYNVSKVDICNAYGIPPLLMGVMDSTYENQNEAKKALWEDTIIPMLNDIKKGLNMWLVPMFGENVYIDYDISGVKALKEDEEKQAKTLSLLVASGICTANEAREILGKTPIADPEADKLVRSDQKPKEEEPKKKQ